LISLTAVLVYDYFDSFDVPRFRRVDGPFKVPKESITIPTRAGLDTLHISGSKRPSPEGLQAHLKDVNMPVYVFDLQSEDHYYINGAPQSWYGYKWDGEAGTDADDVRLRHYLRRLIYTGKLHHGPKDTQTEEQVMADMGFTYLVIPVSRGTIPTAAQVDDYIRVVESLPQPSWVHFHCYNGGGRTSISMIMFDILKNGKDLSIEEICLRHRLLKSENVFDTEVRPGGTYTKEALERRRDFLIAFHRYVNDPEGYGRSSWQEWTDKHDTYKAWDIEQ